MVERRLQRDERAVTPTEEMNRLTQRIDHVAEVIDLDTDRVLGSERSARVTSAAVDGHNGVGQIDRFDDRAPCHRVRHHAGHDHQRSALSWAMFGAQGTAGPFHAELFHNLHSV